MGPRARNMLFAAAALGVGAAYLWEAGWLRPDPVLVRTPEAVARGREVARNRCLACHAVIPLAPRVRGWSPFKAYVNIGRLPSLYPAMPPFPGTEEERRALAVYLSVLGETAP